MGSFIPAKSGGFAYCRGGLLSPTVTINCHRWRPRIYWVFFYFFPK